MNYEIIQEGKFKYIEAGEGEPLMLLHGLFGALSNFKDLIERISNNYVMYSSWFKEETQKP